MSKFISVLILAALARACVPAMAQEMAAPAAPGEQQTTTVGAVAKGEKVAIPCVIYADVDTEGETPFIPSGYMGATEAIEMDDAWKENPQSGSSCIKASFSDPKGWGGVVWQNPANNWGDDEGGVDLTGAKQLSFWARGENGGEMVEFKMGLVAKNKPFYDTAKGGLGKVKLTKEWKQYIIPLTGKDLSRIVTGFCWVTAGKKEPVVFYLDNIVYE